MLIVLAPASDCWLCAGRPQSLGGSLTLTGTKIVTTLALVPGWPAHVCGTGPATGHPEAATRTTAAVARSVVGVYLHVVRGPWQLVKATCVRARLCCAPNSG